MKKTTMMMGRIASAMLLRIVAMQWTTWSPRGSERSVLCRRKAQNTLPRLRRIARERRRLLRRPMSPLGQTAVVSLKQISPSPSLSLNPRSRSSPRPRPHQRLHLRRRGSLRRLVGKLTIFLRKSPERERERLFPLWMKRLPRWYLHHPPMMKAMLTCRRQRISAVP